MNYSHGWMSVSSDGAGAQTEALMDGEQVNNPAVLPVLLAQMMRIKATMNMFLVIYHPMEMELHHAYDLAACVVHMRIYNN